MTCSANPLLSMQPLFNNSMLSDTQLQDEIAKTFLYTGGSPLEQQARVSQLHQNMVAQQRNNANEPSISKIAAHNLGFDTIDCDPIPLRKHPLASSGEVSATQPAKRQRIDSTAVAEDSASIAAQQHQEELAGIVTIPPSNEGISSFEDNDVLSGRGGGTNVHPGNRTFRDLINRHRREYLKAKKNDKPAISRAIVKAIRDAGGRFLKKDNKSKLWFEIGDTLAREKTSQALRQRAPEMRRLMFQSEQEEVNNISQQGQLQQMLLNGMGRNMFQNNLNMFCAGSPNTGMNLVTGHMGVADQSFGLRASGMQRNFPGDSESMILPPQFFKQL